MADYWKSNPRKFCDFCKCWFADNRSSIEFHERGKRHQESVKERLADLAKRGKQSYIEQQQLDADMERMEKAAMAALKRDLTHNPDMASQYGVTLKKRTAAGDRGSGPGGAGVPTQASTALDGAPVPRETTASADGAPVPAQSTPPEKKWLEAKSDQGYTYYWHVDTGEAVWEPPDEGFVPLPDTAPLEPEPAVKQEPQAIVKREPELTVRREPAPAVRREPEPAVKRERPAVKTEECESGAEPPPPAGDVMGPANRPERPDPYGSKWEAVRRTPPPESPPVDLQLPEQRPVKVRPVAGREKARIVFKQRTVTSLGAAGEAFKRRGSDGQKKARNIRQRTDD